MILLKKALRSIWKGKRSYASCILLIALGVASYIGFSQTSIRLTAIMNDMYHMQRFGDAFASVSGISPDAARALSRLEGIAQVTGRTTADVRVLELGDTVLNLHILSHDPQEIQPLDSFLLLKGKAPSRGEIVVSQTFFEAQGLSLGDRLYILTDGRQMRPVVSGVAISPEYISEWSGGTSGYAFMLPEEVSTLAESEGLANYLSFRLEPGTEYRDVEIVLEDALTRYGLKSLYPRKDHPGHYSTEMAFFNLSMIANMLSTIFLTVAALVLYILMRRVIEQERTQIGTMKAFGLSSGKILLVYMGYGGFTGLAGGLLGILVGLGICEYFTGIYLLIMRMPPVKVPVTLSILLTALVLSVVVGLVGAITGAKSVLDLSPAEAMRPPAPPMVKKKRPNTGNNPIAKLMPLEISMALRNISRSRFRSAFVAGGIAVSFSVLTFMSSFAAIRDEVVMDQFTYNQQYDIQLNFKEAQRFSHAVHSAENLPGVTAAEGILEITAIGYHNHILETITVTGLEPNSQMRRLFDSSSRSYVEVPEQGAVVTLSLADKLAIKVGDTVVITTPYTHDRKLPVVVTAIVGENMGRTMYLNLDTMCAMLGTDKAVNTLLLQSNDPAGVSTILTEAKNTGTLQQMAEVRQTVQTMLDQSLGVNVGLFAVIGLGIAFAIIASSASISLSERSREYATLRVLGMTPGQIGKILITEYFLLSAIGFIPGIPLAIGLRGMLMSVMSEDTVAITMNIAAIHYIVGGLFCLVAAVLANLSSIKHIAKLEMTDVLKERE